MAAAPPNKHTQTKAKPRPSQTNPNGQMRRYASTCRRGGALPPPPGAWVSHRHQSTRGISAGHGGFSCRGFSLLLQGLLPSLTGASPFSYRGFSLLLQGFLPSLTGVSLSHRHRPTAGPAIAPRARCFNNKQLRPML